MHDRMKNVFYYRLAKDYNIPNIFFRNINTNLEMRLNLQKSGKKLSSGLL